MRPHERTRDMAYKALIRTAALAAIVASAPVSAEISVE